MSSRLAAAATLTVLSLSGCSTTPAPQPANAQGDVGRRESTAAVAAATPAVTPDQQRLADQTAAYVQQVSLASQPKPVITPAPKAATFPEVQWLLPDTTFSLGPKQEETPAAPSAPTLAQPATAVATTTATPTVVLATPTAAKPAPATPAAPPPPPAVDPLEQRVTQQAKDYPRDLAAHVDHQLLMLLSGQAVPQMDAIAGLAKEDRELLAALMDGLTNLRAAARSDKNILLAQKVRPLLDMADRLRAQADLRVPTIALCLRIDGFGVYEPLATGNFVAGKEHWPVLYCEVENFQSRVNEKSMWETNLKQELMITNERGQVVLREEARAVSDVARRRRSDFFLGQRVRIPSSLPPGKYKLTVTVTDAQSNRVAEAKTDLELLAVGNK